MPAREDYLDGRERCAHLLRQDSPETLRNKARWGSERNGTWRFEPCWETERAPRSGVRLHNPCAVAMPPLSATTCPEDKPPQPRKLACKAGRLVYDGHAVMQLSGTDLGAEVWGCSVGIPEPWWNRPVSGAPLPGNLRSPVAGRGPPICKSARRSEFGHQLPPLI